MRILQRYYTSKNGVGVLMNGLSKWECQLRDYYSLVETITNEREKNKGSLRFGRFFVLASDIAEQYFCEKKVEMQYLQGEIETEAKTLGTEAHEKLLEDSIRIKRQDLWQKIYEDKPVFALEMLLLAKYKGVLLAGRPDSILFRKGVPLVVFEYKFSRSVTAYMTHHVQARTYGILLSKMGFDTSRLFYAIVLVDPRSREDKHLKQRVIDAIIENGPKEALLKVENAAIHVHRFNQRDGEKDVDWAIGLWNKSREAIPTTNLNKCRGCEYNEDCKKSSG